VNASDDTGQAAESEDSTEKLKFGDGGEVGKDSGEETPE